MTNLFTRIRWRLVGWNMLIVGLILLLLGTTVYISLERSLMAEVDRNLANRAEQALPPLTRPDPHPPGLEGFRGGVFYLAYGPDGHLFGNPQQVDSTAADALPTPTGRAPEFSTTEINGEPVRVAVRRMPDGGKLVVGQSVAPERAAVQSLLWVLLGGAGFGLLLALGGAWFLAGRALVPIQQAFQRQQQFVADASHELRTPLTVLQSSAALLDQHRAEPLEHNAELLDDIRDEIARMVRLTSDLLTLARTDRGDLELMTAPFDLASLASDVARKVLPLAHSKGVQVAVPTGAAGPTIEADPDRIQQVLLILLDNAIKHTPSDGQVELHVGRQGSVATLEVVDTGEGIPADHLERLFERFYRVDSARSRAAGGTGLGLAIAKTLVDAHGGDVSISSRVGQGTRVTVRLPLDGHSRALGARLSRLAAHFAHTSAQQ
jgi:signal transduction histidine kinase